MRKLLVALRIQNSARFGIPALGVENLGIMPVESDVQAHFVTGCEVVHPKVHDDVRGHQMIHACAANA
jgi:hypothetical protein